MHFLLSAVNLPRPRKAAMILQCMAFLKDAPVRRKHLLRRPVWILSSVGVVLVAVLIVGVITFLNGGAKLVH
jgi:predicted anti-sigma-YlaC factor YlaD